MSQAPDFVPVSTFHASRPTAGRRHVLDALGFVDLRPVLAGDVTRPEPAVFRRHDRFALIYLTAINLIFGDSGAGKGWLTLFAAAQQIRAGHRVILVDFEDTPESIVSRLLILGLRSDEIAERFLYLRPNEPLEHGDIERLADKLVDLVPAVSLVIFDSLGEAFGLAGINENADNEVGPWLRKILRPLADVGPAVIAIDHVTKAGESPLHPSGSKRKRAAVGGAAYRVDAVKPFTAQTGGRLRIVCAKDRHGWFGRGEHVADLVATVGPGGTRFELYAPSRKIDGGDPLSGTILDVVAEQGPISARKIEEHVRDRGISGKSTKIRDAIKGLTSDGELDEVAGPIKGSKLLAVPAADTSEPPSEEPS